LGQFHDGKEGVRIIRIIERKEVDNHKGREKDEVFSIVMGKREEEVKVSCVKRLRKKNGYLGGKKVLDKYRYHGGDRGEMYTVHVQVS
jgi:hypothetical protein